MGINQFSPRARERQPRLRRGPAEQTDRSTKYLQTQGELLGLAGQIPDAGLTRQVAYRIGHEWQQRTHMLLHAEPETGQGSAFTRVRRLSAGLKKYEYEMKPLPTQMEKLMYISQEKTLNPLDIKDHLDQMRQTLATLLEQKDPTQPPPATLLLGGEAMLAEAQNIIDTYEACIGPTPDALVRPSRFTKTEAKEKLDAQATTMLRIAGLAIALPLFLFTTLSYLFEKDETKKSLLGPGLWLMALLLTTVGLWGKDWKKEISFLSEGPFAEIMKNPHYGLQDPLRGPAFAELGDKLQRGIVASSVQDLLALPGKLDPEQQKKVIGALAPNPAIAENLLAMMNDGDGEAFRIFVKTMQAPRTQEAQAFVKQFMQAGAGPHAFAALPIRGGQPLPQQPQPGVATI